MLQEILINNRNKIYFKVNEDTKGYNNISRKKQYNNKILICGSRNYSNYMKIESMIKILNPDCIIQGGANGADRLSREISKKLNIDCIEYLAEWNIYGKKAGPIRNRKMLDENRDIKLIIAFHDDISKSFGTKDMISYALKKGYEVKVVNETPFINNYNILEDESIITYVNKIEEDKIIYKFTGKLF